MRSAKNLFLFLLISSLTGGSLLINHTTTAQDFNYTHYTVRNGLAGSTVYCMYQDKEGFLWFGTETGVSRFDGSQFKNLTIKDGLPDNTIVRIYGDSKGRIWLLPFQQSICFYYEGKIHNQENDSLLKQLQITDFITEISEDPAQNIVIMNRSELYCISATGKVTSVPWHGSDKIFMTKIAMSQTGSLYILAANNVYRSSGGGFRLHSELRSLSAGGGQVIIHDQLLCWTTAPNELRIKSAKYHLEYSYKVPPVNTLSRLNDSMICINTTQGTIVLDILRRKIINHFLSHVNVSNYLTDSEDGIWFSTLNNGVYRLNSIQVKNITIPAIPDQRMSVYDLQKDGNTILVGSDRGYLQMIPENSSRPISLSQLHLPLNHPVTSIKKRGDNLALTCGQNLFLKTGPTTLRYSAATTSIKDISFKNDKELIVASSGGLYNMQVATLKIQEVLWQGRTTSLLTRNNIIYFGALDGLYQLKADKRVAYFGDRFAQLRHRISAIREGKNNIIWVATGNAGIIGLKDDEIVWQFNTGNGLASNNCRSLFSDNDHIWAGTDKGLHKIDLTTVPAAVTIYTVADGLPSDVINTILLDNDHVYVGTPEGVSYFNKKTTLGMSRCHLKILGITANGVRSENTRMLTLKYGTNISRIDFVGISLKSYGDIHYTYRVQGLDTGWSTTTQTSLEFISLPAGKYKFELFATNKFGIRSETEIVQMIIPAPFWQTAWFIALAISGIIIITWSAFVKRNQFLKNKEAVKSDFEQKLQQLEQKALQAQMNPHFIFNCLNAVQDFIQDHDMDSANKYISNFARLIRQTLDISLQPIITIADEIKYLATYLSLEQMHFQGSFNYAIHVDKNIAGTRTFIPCMILQPYLENAILHGIGNKKGEKGHIDLAFRRANETIECRISDNGVGRKVAAALKAGLQEDYPSRGMQLTRERIDIINKSQQAKIVVKLSDLTDANGNIAGTIVTVWFPLIQKETKRQYDDPVHNC